MKNLTVIVLLILMLTALVPRARAQEHSWTVSVAGDLDERIERQLGPELPKRMAAIRERVDHLQSLGFIEREGPRIRLAPERLTVSNEVFIQLLA